MAKTIKTWAESRYVVTMTEAGTVKGLYNGREVVLVTLAAPGQADFVAISGETLVSDDAAIVIRTTSSAGGGVSKSTVIETIDDILFTATYSTAEGSTPHSWRWCHIDKANVHAGELREICLHVPEAFNTTNFTDTPRYLSVYQYRNNAWKGVAVSQNACRIEPGTDMVFTFPRGTQLSENSLRLCPGNDDGTMAWREDISFMTLCSPASDGSSIRQPASVAAIPYITFTMSGEQRVSMTDHTADIVVHLTAEEHEGLTALLAAKDQILAAFPTTSTTEYLEPETVTDEEPEEVEGEAIPLDEEL